MSRRCASYSTMKTASACSKEKQRSRNRSSSPRLRLCYREVTMGRYIVPGSVIALSTAFKTGLQAYATSGATRRGFLMGIDISQIGAPSGTDCQIQYDIPRITVGSTSMTTYTPNDVSGGADAAAAMTAGIGSTGSTEPTVTANSQL